jgi:hypothetical protein
MSIQADRALDETGRARAHKSTNIESAQRAVRQPPTLTLLDDKLTVAEPSVVANSAWHDAMMQLASWMGVSIQPVQDRSFGLKQRIKWPWGAHAEPDAPVFAPWLSYASTEFQDPRSQREPSPARWVASYLWDPCCSSRLVKGGTIDVMLISPHPAACRNDEESSASLPSVGLMQDMIGAACAEGRSRIAFIGFERTQNVTARQLLSPKGKFPFAQLDLEVLAIEEALGRLTSGPTSWDAIIVLPELRSMILALLGRLTGIGGAWPMVWHGKGLVLVCGESPNQIVPNSPLDAALLVQSLALVARNGGRSLAARRVTEGWARLRDRGMVTPLRGSPAPYCMQTSDAAIVEELARTSDLAGRPVAAWKAMSSMHTEESDAAMRPARLELVTDR